MNTSTPSCLAASAAIHAAAFVFLLLVPSLVPSPSKQPDSPVLELIPADLKLTDGTTVGGGNPNAKPVVSAPPNVPPPVVAPPPEVPKLQKPEVPVVQKPEQPKPDLAKDTKLNRSVTPSRAVITPQDVDKTLPAPAPAKKPIQLAEATKKRSKDEVQSDRLEKAAAEAEAKADKERREKAAATRAAWERAQQQRANALRGAASSLGNSLAGSTSIEMPGPGGAAYAPYGVYLAAFYKLRWKKPATLSVDRGEVGAEITVRRDGVVTSFRIIDPSGIKPLDDSVREVLDKNRKLNPLPEGTTDSERTISIRFDLTAASST